LRTQHQQATAVQQLLLTLRCLRPEVLLVRCLLQALEQLQFLVCHLLQVIRLWCTQPTLLVIAQIVQAVIALQQARQQDKQHTHLPECIHGLFLQGLLVFLPWQYQEAVVVTVHLMLAVVAAVAWFIQIM
jgi:hypothetical protein